ncbi:hypothetical protein D3C73_923800 [compost metagenome]
MLAGHGGIVALVIGGCVGGITGSVDIGVAEHLQVAVNVQATLRVTGAGHLLGERAGTETDGPDHRVRLNVLAIAQRHTVGIHRGDRGVEHPLDTQFIRRFDQRRTNAGAQRGTRGRRTVDHDHADRCIVTQCSTQAGGHFGGGLDAGEATAANNHGVASRCARQVLQCFDMRFESRGRFDFVHVKGVLDNTWQRSGAVESTAGSQYQSVIAQDTVGAIDVAVADLLVVGIDILGAAFDEFDAHGGEQVSQVRLHGVDIGLVEARTDAQLGLWSQEGDLHVVAVMLVQQTGGAQRAPDSTKPCANN